MQETFEAFDVEAKATETRLTEKMDAAEADRLEREVASAEALETRFTTLEAERVAREEAAPRRWRSGAAARSEAEAR